MGEAMEILHSINIHLSKAVLLKNAFTGEAVTSGVMLCTTDGRKPVRKPGGYYLFLNMRQMAFTVEIESPVYQKQTVNLQADANDEAEEIWLYPNRSYPAGSSSTVIEGEAAPGELCRFYLKAEEKSSRLLNDCSQGDTQISVFLKDRKAKTSGLWYIWDKERNDGEFIRLHSVSEDEELCGLSEPVQSGYQRKSAVLYPAFECPADEEGVVYLLLDRLEEREYTLCRVSRRQDKNETAERKIQGMTWNHLTDVGGE